MNKHQGSIIEKPAQANESHPGAAQVVIKHDDVNPAQPAVRTSTNDARSPKPQATPQKIAPTFSWRQAGQEVVWGAAWGAGTLTAMSVLTLGLTSCAQTLYDAKNAVDGLDMVLQM